MMQTYQEIIIIIVFMSVILFSLKTVMGAPGPDYEKELKVANDALSDQQSNLSNKLFRPLLGQPAVHKAVDVGIQNILQYCGLVFDNEKNNEYSILCDKIVRAVDLQCRESYYTPCFGPNVWANFEAQKHKNPDWCKSKTNLKGEDC